MWKKIKDWHTRYDVEITWFLIGVLLDAGLNNLATASYGSAAVCFVIAYLNFILRNSKP